MGRTLEEIGISARTAGLLRRGHVRDVAALRLNSRESLGAIKGIGKGRLREIESALAGAELRLLSKKTARKLAPAREALGEEPGRLDLLGEARKEKRIRDGVRIDIDLGRAEKRFRGVHPRVVAHSDPEVKAAASRIQRAVIAKANAERPADERSPHYDDLPPEAQLEIDRQIAILTLRGNGEGVLVYGEEEFNLEALDTQQTQAAFQRLAEADLPPPDWFWADLHAAGRIADLIPAEELSREGKGHAFGLRVEVAQFVGVLEKLRSLGTSPGSKPSSSAKAPTPSSTTGAVRAPTP